MTRPGAAFHHRFSCMLIAFTMGWIPLAFAQWSNDPNVNFAVADHPSDQVIPLIGSASDGGSYVAWFDNVPMMGYQVYLQRLTASGVEIFPHNGILISSHPQNTALFGWDMMVDSHDNAVIVFSDQRDGGDLDTFAYKISPTGVFIWGPDGVQLSVDPDFDPAPRVAEASNGDFVFVWQRDPSTGDADIRMQRLTAAGVSLFPSNGLPVVVSVGEDPGFVQIVPAENGNVILSWLRNIRSFSSPRHIRARKFSPSGVPVWATNTVVFDAFPLPIGYFPIMLADGAGGAVFAWHRSDGSLYNSFLQHVDTNGVEMFPHNGVPVSTTAGMYHINPALAYNKVSGEAFIFWNEENTLQSQWGVFGQKFSPAGAPQWGAGGATLVPVSATNRSIPRTVPYADGAMVFWLDEPGGFGSDRLLAERVDGWGNPVWFGSQVLMSSHPSTKGRYPITQAPNGTATLVWEDNRNGTVDVFGQNIDPNGKLAPASIPGTIGTSLRVAKSTLTPGNLRLTWSASCSAAAIDYAIYEGDLGAFGSHTKKDCSDDGGDHAEEITPRPGNAYYLVVALTASEEGSYGRNSAGAERGTPVSPADRCIASQSVTSCGP